MLKIRGLWRIRRLGAQLRFHLSRRAVVLLYHRVTDLESDPQLLAVSPTNFAAHLEIIRDNCRPLVLQELGAAITQKRIPHRGVVVTFDDGYADNLTIAKPLMERFQVPGTVFVSSGALDKAWPFWWDELAWLLLGRDDLPASLVTHLGGNTVEWKLLNPGWPTTGSGSEASWSVLSPTDPTPAHTVYRELCICIRPLDTQDRAIVLASIRQQLGTPRLSATDCRALTSSELLELAKGGLVEIGAHTVNHVLLSAMSQARQVEEVAVSKRVLEGILTSSVASFSYPFGGLSDYSTTTVDTVKVSGFSCCCSNFEGIVTKASDRYQIPRFLVRNWDGPTFAAKLHQWLTRPSAC